MKALKSNLSILLGVVLIAVKVVIIYRMYLLPQEILTLVDVTEHTQVTRAKTVMPALYYWFAFDFILVIALAYAIVNQKLTLSIQEGDFIDEVDNEEVWTAENAGQGGDDKLNEKLMTLQTTMTSLLYEADERNVEKKLEVLLSSICGLVNASAGIIYLTFEKEGVQYIQFSVGFAVYQPETNRQIYEFGEGFPGQVAKSRKTVIIKDVPEGYISLISGLGNAKPGSLMLLPCMKGDEVKAVLEIAAFHTFTFEQKDILDDASREIVRLIEANEEPA